MRSYMQTSGSVHEDGCQHGSYQSTNLANSSIISQQLLLAACYDVGGFNYTAVAPILSNKFKFSMGERPVKAAVRPHTNVETHLTYSQVSTCGIPLQLRQLYNGVTSPAYASLGVVVLYTHSDRRTHRSSGSGERNAMNEEFYGSEELSRLDQLCASRGTKRQRVISSAAALEASHILSEELGDTPYSEGKRRKGLSRPWRTIHFRRIYYLSFGTWPINYVFGTHKLLLLT